MPNVFLASMFDSALRNPILERCRDAVWDPERIDRGGKSVEDICRQLIRRSKRLVAVLDAREGRALAFEDLKTPVTVLEIELIQALFQRIPINVISLPGFERNPRLYNLVKMAEAFGVLTVTSITDCRSTHRGTELEPGSVTKICHIIRGRFWRPLLDPLSQMIRRLRRFDRLDVEILNGEFASFRDEFDAKTCGRLISHAATQTDHAARLAILWAALRQLCTVAYSEVRSPEIIQLWERLLSEWIRSAGWYGLHDDTPFSLLAAINSISIVREHIASGDGERSLDTRGALASAYYSLSRRTLLPWHRRQLLMRALLKVDDALKEGCGNPSGLLSIRGSINLRLWRLERAVNDYKRVVEMRRSKNTNERAIGEALTELGWALSWMLRFHDARLAFEEGITLARPKDPAIVQGVDFFIRAQFKYGIFLIVTMRFSAAADMLREACLLANDRIARDQVRGIRRVLCRIAAR